MSSFFCSWGCGKGGGGSGNLCRENMSEYMKYLLLYLNQGLHQSRDVPAERRWSLDPGNWVRQRSETTAGRWGSHIYGRGSVVYPSGNLMGAKDIQYKIG